jgi:hypothetical protein
MAKRKSKTVTFDAMVKFFMQTYDIPTKKDVDKLLARLDRIEKLLKSAGISRRRGRPAGKQQAKYRLRRGSSAMTATEKVYQFIGKHKQGIGVNELSIKTGFDVKKIRNIIFRLNKNGMIKRKSRGLYVVS